jgi:hypothetical protein
VSLELRVVRERTREQATLGALYVDHVWECWTLEDAIRERPGQPVADWKIAGKTAIPAGRYRVIITPSVRFQRPLPLLLNVPGFTGIRIHPGNGPLDTEGCLCVGRVRRIASVRESQLAFGPLIERLTHAVDEIWISVENPRLPELLAA